MPISDDFQKIFSKCQINGRNGIYAPQNLTLDGFVGDCGHMGLALKSFSKGPTLEDLTIFIIINKIKTAKKILHSH